MINCKEINELISLYMDNELDELTRKAFEEHVNLCKDCKDNLDELLSMKELLGSIEEVELPEGFKATLHEKLMEEKQKKENKSKFLLINSKYIKIISSVAACILLVFAVRGLWMQNERYTENSFLQDQRSGENKELSIAMDNAESNKAVSNNTLAYEDSVEMKRSGNAEVESSSVIESVQDFEESMQNTRSSGSGANPQNDFGSEIGRAHV